MSASLIAELLAMAAEVGPNECAWPGLTVWRFDRPQAPQWVDVQSLTICWIAQGCKRLLVEDIEYLGEPASYLLFRRGMRIQAEILKATVETPYLSFVLQIDPAVVRSVLSDMADHRTASTGSAPNSAQLAAAHLSPADRPLMDAALRFLQSLNTDAERRVLAPIYLREITYRLMKSEQATRMLDAAAAEHESHPVAEVIEYARERISEPMTVASMAHRAGMSPSALTSAFKEATGLGPYQFVKRMRLDRARELILRDGMNVSEAARNVGYSSVSYFVTEFKRHFGASPRRYAEKQRDAVVMRVGESINWPDVDS